HARCIDEFLRVMINLPSFASTALVNVKSVSLNCGSGWRRQIDFVFYRLSVISKLQVGAIDAVKFPNHSQKIRLSTNQVSHNAIPEHCRSAAQPRCLRDSTRCVSTSSL